MKIITTKYSFFIVLIFSFGMLVSCSTNTQKNEIKKTEKAKETKTTQISDLSIYQLTSNWETQKNETITFEDLKGNTLVMMMMFTSCKTSCPRLVTDIKDIEKKVSVNKNKGIKYVLISIDSKNDTPEVLKEFAVKNKLIGDQWLLLHGSKENIREFANVVAVSYKEISPINFSHSNIISIFNEVGELKYQQQGFKDENTEIVNEIIR